MADYLSPLVTLNVGGRCFTTTRDTVLRESSSRLALMVRRVLPTVKDEAGQVFIDRDPRHFQTILNYLRDGWTVLPATAVERQELMREARYFQLPGFEAWVRTQELLGSKSDAIPPSPRSEHSSMAALSQRGDSVGSVGSPHAVPAASKALLPVGRPLSASLDDGYRWTAKYLRTNTQLRQVVETLVDLVNMPPHSGSVSSTSLPRGECCGCVHTNPWCGRVFVSITSFPEYGSVGSRYLLAKVTSSSGWSYECTIHPCVDLCMYNKYNIAEYVQDNWFVLCAVLKDQYRICMEEDYTAAKPCSILSKRFNLNVVLSRI